MKIIICILFLNLCEGSMFNLEPANAAIRKLLEKCNPGISTLINIPSVISDLPSALPRLANAVEAVPEPLIMSPVIESCALFVQNSVSTLESYINLEMTYYGLSPGPSLKSLQFKKTLTFIANNDYNGFVDNEYFFEQAFKCKPHLLKRNNINYISHYIIRFGATNFVSYLRTKFSASSLTSADINRALEHLVATKDLNVVIEMLAGRKSFNKKDVLVLVKVVEKKHPRLNFLDMLVFQGLNRSSRIYELAKEIFETSDDLDKFRKLQEIIKYESSLLTVSIESIIQERLVLVPKLFPVFFQRLSMGEKFYLAHMALFHHKLDSFKLIVEMDTRVLFYYNSRRKNQKTLLHLAVATDSVTAVEFILDIFPELANVYSQDESSAFDLAISFSKTAMIDAFERAGATFLTGHLYKGRVLNRFQYSFLQKNQPVFAYFLAKLSKEHALQDLLDAFGSLNEIVKHAVQTTSIFTDFELLKLLVTKFDIDLKAKIYRDGDTVGDATIFIPPYRQSSFKSVFGYRS